MDTSEQMRRGLDAASQVQQQQMTLIGRLFEVAQPDRVFSSPIQSGDQTVITASEVMLGMGLGMGLGLGGGSSPVTSVEGVSTGTGQGSGGGGGGGGFSRGRPVAAIVMGPEGVRVEPILDLTQVALAFFTMFVTMMVTMGRMRRAMHR